MSQTVRLLLENGADVTMNEGAALMAAVTKGHNEVGLQPVPVFDGLTGGTDTVRRAQRGDTETGRALPGSGFLAQPLLLSTFSPAAATQLGFIPYNEVVRLLLENGANDDINAGAALTAACRLRYNNTDMVRLLLENEADVKLNPDAALTAAFASGCIETVKLLLERGVDLRVVNPGAALTIASRNGDCESLHFLLENGVDVNLPAQNLGDHALAAALKENHIDTVRLLLENGVDVDKNAGAALTAACGSWHCNIEIVQLLLKAGATVNINSGAACASRSGNTEMIVGLLLKSGANVNSVNTDSTYGTALAAACEVGRLEIVRLLLANGADVRLNGGTAVTAACGAWNANLGPLKRGADSLNPALELAYTVLLNSIRQGV
ncbi:ankyrin repeat-containing domain protein [Mycena leptocephala]|nr:ankyrin repeat-containing domain protein [Mycena leptocephala]